jgi:hypothetical protein
MVRADSPPVPRRAPLFTNLDSHSFTSEPRTGTLLLMHALATTEWDFANGILNQLANASSKRGEADESGLNFMLSVVKTIAPEDEIETMLAAQMAAVHVATMTFATRLNHVETIQQQDSTERALNKLARTFASQVEAFKRYRTGGEQKVTVQHVSVNDNAQAIVGRKVETMPSRRLPAARQNPKGPDNPARLQLCVVTTSAASVVPEGEHPRARPMVLGSMGTTVKDQRLSAS